MRILISGWENLRLSGFGVKHRVIFFFSVVGNGREVARVYEAWICMVF